MTELQKKITTTDAHFTQVLELVRRGGYAEEIEGLLRAGAGGRPRQLSVEVLFTCMIIYYESTNTIIFRHMYRYFMKNIPIPTKVKYGLSDSKGNMLVQEYQVNYLRHRIEKVLRYTSVASGTYEVDGVKAEYFQTILDKIIDSVQPQNLPPATKYAMDSTFIESNARRTARKKDGTNSKDIDARIGHRTDTQSKPSEMANGYDALTVTGAPVKDEDIPNICSGLVLLPGASDQSDAIRHILEHQKELGRLGKKYIADKAYNNYKRERFLDILRKYDANQCIDMRAEQHGVYFYHGIPIIDGTPHCPQVLDYPELLTIIKPAVSQKEKLDPNDFAAVQAETIAKNAALGDFFSLIEQRQQFAFKHHSYTKKGRRWTAPCWKGKAICSNCPLSKGMSLDAGIPIWDNPPKTPTRGCLKERVEIPNVIYNDNGEELVNVSKALQHDYWGSKEWFKDWNKRPRIEGTYGDLQQADKGGIRKGWIKVTGIVNNGIALAFALVVAAMKNIWAWQDRHPEQIADDLICRKLPEVQFVEIPVDTLALLDSEHLEPPEIAWVMAPGR